MKTITAAQCSSTAAHTQACKLLYRVNMAAHHIINMTLTPSQLHTAHLNMEPWLQGKVSPTILRAPVAERVNTICQSAGSALKNLRMRDRTCDV